MKVRLIRKAKITDNIVDQDFYLAKEDIKKGDCLVFDSNGDIEPGGIISLDC